MEWNLSRDVVLRVERLRQAAILLRVLELYDLYLYGVVWREIQRETIAGIYGTAIPMSERFKLMRVSQVGHFRPLSKSTPRITRNFAHLSVCPTD